MRLKKCVLSLLRKLVRVEMSLMSDGSSLPKLTICSIAILLSTWYINVVIDTFYVLYFMYYDKLHFVFMCLLLI